MREFQDLLEMNDQQRKLLQVIYLDPFSIFIEDICKNVCNSLLSHIIVIPARFWPGSSDLRKDGEFGTVYVLHLAGGANG